MKGVFEYQDGCLGTIYVPFISVCFFYEHECGLNICLKGWNNSFNLDHDLKERFFKEYENWLAKEGKG